MKPLSLGSFVLMAFCLAAVTACDEDQDKPQKTDAASGKDGGLDGAKPDGPKTDAAKSDAAKSDAAKSDAAKSDAAPKSEIANAFGFIMRTPKTKVTLTCKKDASNPQGIESIDAEEMDWICTFVYNGEKAYTYFQMSPVACQSMGMSMGAEYQAKVAQISSEGKMSSLTNATYDWGGNHHNDSVDFSYQNSYFKYYHSSFGFGWRQCQPLDCLQVFKAKDGEAILDGCTKDRKLPIVCLRVEAGKSYQADSFKDNFKLCAGDPNAP
jgi:hypothetical protein